MADSNQKISYFNTLMFTVITGIVSLCILSLLFFEFGQKFLYFIIAFEVGVFILIGYTIFKIIRMNSKIKPTNYVIKFDECPDYYTKKIINGDEVCVNDYVVKDPTGKVYVIKLTPSQIGGVPEEVPKTITLDGSSMVYQKFPLRDLERDENIPKLDDKCKLLFKMPPSDDKYKKHMHYSYIPWTYAKGRCEGMV